MLFPQLANSNFGHINLEREAESYNKIHKPKGSNPLLAPSECQKLVDNFHHQHNLAWSYGGYLENRKKLWAGSYLDKIHSYLHLGMDYNVPAGITVALPWEAKIIHTDHDADLDGGWGGRMIAQPTDRELSEHLFIFAHLSAEIHAQVGEVLDKDSVIGTVGAPEVNGGWFSHLHIQAITKAEFNIAIHKNLTDLDGYGRFSKRKELSLKFPDPTKFIPFH